MGKKKITVPVYSDLDPRKLENFSKVQRRNYLNTINSIMIDFQDLENHYSEFMNNQEKCNNCENCKRNITIDYIRTRVKLEKEYKTISNKLSNLNRLERIIFQMDLPSSELNNIDILKLINMESKICPGDILGLLQKNKTIFYRC